MIPDILLGGTLKIVKVHHEGLANLWRNVYKLRGYKYCFSTQMTVIRKVTLIVGMLVTSRKPGDLEIARHPRINKSLVKQSIPNLAPIGKG